MFIQIQMLLLTSSFLICYLGNKKLLLTYIPLWGLWLSIMVTTPVFSELRYVYDLFTCMPLLLFIPILNRQKSTM